MRERFFMAGMFSMALTFVLVLGGCNDGTTSVEGNVGINAARPGAPSNVAVSTKRDSVYQYTLGGTVYTTTSSYYIVTWDAGDNASNYEVVLQQENKKTIQSVSQVSSGMKSLDSIPLTNKSIYSVASSNTGYPYGLTSTDNIKSDDWTGGFYYNTYSDTAYPTSNTNSKPTTLSGTYKIGVRATSLNDASTPSGKSGITWASGTVSF